MNLYGGSGLKQLANTQTHRPLLGGLLSPEIIPRRWWWVWNTFTLRLYFSLCCQVQTLM